MAIVEVKVPDIGDFQHVDVIEVLVKPGDFIMPEDSLITLESDKATMEVPSPYGGEVKELIIQVGDKVSEGAPILTMEVATADEEEEEEPEEKEEADATGTEQEETAQTSTAKRVATEGEIQTEVVVLGAGPGGYTAAFRAADLGKQVVLIERYPSLGGVCLNVGCIPSKALLHVAQIIHEAAEMREWGVEFGDPQINVNKLVDWKNTVVGKLTGGLAGLAVKRNVKVIQGVGKFTSPNQIQVETSQGTVTVSFEQAIIAAGSQAIKLPYLPNDDRYDV